MAEFEQLRDQLIEHRETRERARLDALSAVEQLRSIEREAIEIDRRSGRDSDERHAIQERRRAASEKANATSAALSEIDRRAVGIGAELEEFTDPIKGLNLLSSRHPILLFPLRIETRFKASETGQPQLWVRVYPDECLVDSFEESLTKNEIKKGTVFWAEIWRAMGDEAAERAAWGNLVKSCGSGRAAWIIRNFLPTNSVDKPEPESGVVRLVIAGTENPPQAVIDYWIAAWGAGGDAITLMTARDALNASVGSDEAETIVANPPIGFDEKPTGAASTAKISILLVPSPDPSTLRDAAWSSAPRIDVLPDRLVLLAYDSLNAEPKAHLGKPLLTPLVAGPDPNAPPTEQLKPTGADPDHPDTLQIPDNLKWMFDFEKALEVGMAFRFDLNADQAARGFERLVVLGVRITDTAASGTKALERLLEHHLYSRKGLELLAQGTPTNDSESGGSGYSWRENSDASFGPLFKHQSAFDPPTPPGTLEDGQYLAAALGMDEALIGLIPGAGLSDRAEAQAMQIALWPATIGYFMDALMEPVFDDAAVTKTRDFFTRHVSGRGPIAALRIGMQPYGIQPVASFDRLAWFNGENAEGSYYSRLVSLIRKVEADYQALLSKVSRIGADHDDSHQALLDVLGLHPTSAEYYPLLADSLEQKAHELSFFDASLVARLLSLFPKEEPIDLLRRLGYGGAELPDLLTKIYRSRQTPLDGPVVDDVPLSENKPIRAYAAGRNYIEWLIAAAEDSVAAVQAEQGFDKNKRPKALLYLLLRHGVLLGLRDTAINLMIEAGILSRADATRKEPAFIHVSEGQGLASESRYAVLFQKEARVTQNDDLLIGDYVAKHARALDKSLLPEHLKALELLAKLPTARLERLFAEHIDTVSYRLDAWKTGILDFGLQQLRRAGSDVGANITIHGGRIGQAGGTYLGAYGWVEHLRPEGKELVPAELPQPLADLIDAHDQGPLMKDPTNLGLVHAPSISQASTAAVLRNAYVAHSGKLSVNLSSRRVRTALSILEGMREGQSIGALLGYHFERHVHDHGPLGARALVYPLRREFPLAANQIKSTATKDGEAKESIAAMNVIDGRKLLLRVEETKVEAYPFGVGALPRDPGAKETALSNAFAYIKDINDAVADLVLSETVHQAVVGNYERSAAISDAFAKGRSPGEPDVVRTPRSGTQLTLRTAVHLEPGAVNPWPSVAMSPLALSEPALNHWVAARLPTPDKVAVLVDYVDRTTGNTKTATITQKDLGLQAADMLYRAQPRSDQALGDLDDLILARLHDIAPVSLGGPIRIKHTARIADKVTFFELEGLLRSLRRILVGSRPLRASDLVRSVDAENSEGSAPSVPVARLSDARSELHDTHLPALEALKVKIADPARTIDELITLYGMAASPLASYRITGAGAGFALEQRAAIYASLTGQLQIRIDIWEDRLGSYDNVMAEFAALPGSADEEQKLQLLRTAEALVSTSVNADLTSAALLPIVAGKHDALVTKRDTLIEIAAVPRATLTELVVDAEAAADLTGLDHDPLDLSKASGEVSRLRDDLMNGATRLIVEVQKRIDGADDTLAKHGIVAPAQQADIVAGGLKAIFGEDFLVVPEFSLASEPATELANALAHSRSGDLTKYLTDPAPGGSGRDFPEEDWLHGVARVRDRMHHLENVILLSDNLPGASAPPFLPIQLPHAPDQPWFALELPPKVNPEGDKLLYTSCFDPGLDPTAPMCGLMIDEWAEVIPARQQTTGVAFHHDRPNSEPPQAWLLALPATPGQAWAWDDLLGAINDTLDSAKRRAIEPTHLDATPYANFVPATHSPFTYPEISISNNLLKNVDIFERMDRTIS